MSQKRTSTNAPRSRPLRVSTLGAIALWVALAGWPADAMASGWSPLGLGTNGQVDTLLPVGTDLYVGGSFSTAGGSAAGFIAKWDGSAWSPLGRC
mgnify:CR=1 FL=1